MFSRQLTTINRIFLLFVAMLFVGTGCVGQDSRVSIDGFVLESFEGETIAFSDFEGQPVFIDFWASWCPFCIHEIPEIQKIHETYEDLVVIGIHRSDTESYERGKEFIDELGVTYLVLKDEDGSVYQFYSGGRPLMPLAVLIDEHGEIQDQLLGPKTAEQMAEKLMKLLGDE